jgi:hypothetical protein
VDLHGPSPRCTNRHPLQLTPARPVRRATIAREPATLGIRLRESRWRGCRRRGIRPFTPCIVNQRHLRGLLCRARRHSAPTSCPRGSNPARLRGNRCDARQHRRVEDVGRRRTGLPAPPAEAREPAAAKTGRYP